MVAQHSLQNELHDAFESDHKLKLRVDSLVEEKVVNDHGSPTREQNVVKREFACHYPIEEMGGEKKKDRMKSPFTVSHYLKLLTCPLSVQYLEQKRVVAFRAGSISFKGNRKLYFLYLLEA